MHLHFCGNPFFVKHGAESLKAILLTLNNHCIKGVPVFMDTRVATVKSITGKFLSEALFRVKET